MKEFTLSPKQIESIQNSTGRQSLWCGSVRSGKTFSSILRFISLCQTLPKGDALICGVSRDTVQRNILPSLCELCNIPLPTSKSNTMMLLGRRVHLLGAPDESAVRRIKGATLALAYLDELTDIPEPFYKMILSRLSVDDAKLIATTNPESPTHWLKEKVIDNPDINLTVFYFGLEDNPSLSQSYKDELTKEYSGVWYDRYILGQWTRAEGVVFDGFDPAINVVDEIKRTRGIKIAGCDYGTTNPTCVLVADIKVNEWPQIYIEKEFYFDPAVKGFTMTDGEQADAIFDFLKGENIEALYVDPAAASLKLELQRKDLPVINAKNDVLTGIKHCNKFLSQLNIVINRGCKNLIKQLQSYSWDPKMTDKGIDAPIKKEDHAADAFKYLCFSHFPNGELEDFYDAEKLESLYKEAMREMNEGY